MSCDTAARAQLLPPKLDRVRSDPRVKIVDEAPRMFLVEASENDAESLRGELGGCSSAKSNSTRARDSRPKPRA